ncbi:MAG: ATP-binding protein [Myxococcales bacterium]|nr:ATP-binding protein [Myxococcales bacterium]MCB9716035.1 ATP-binding protein [Myxococcales bacterium]
MDFADRKLYYNRCDPSEALAPDDERNVDLDAEAVGGYRPRGVVWVERLASEIELSDDPTCTLFTGLPGSGKSTELRRLLAHLADPQGMHLLGVLVDAERVLDLTTRVDIPDIIAAIVYAVDEKVLEAEGRQGKAALQEGYLTRLWHWLTTTDVELGEGELAVGDAGKLVFELKTRDSLRQRVRRTVAANLTAFLGQAREELVALEERARRAGWGGLIVVLDSLEKLRGVSENWHDVLASAEQVFGRGAPYLQLPVHVIYTVPAALVARQHQGIEFMPMVKLRHRDGTVFAPGVETMRKLVHQRIPGPVLAHLLGDQARERLDELILASGGYTREVIRFLRAIVRERQHPLSQDAYERILNELRDDYRAVVPSEAFDWLAQVAVDRYLTIHDEEHRASADLMLLNNVVMRYMNQRDWYDLHPVVYEIPGVAEAIARARARKGEGAGGNESS